MGQVSSCPVMVMAWVEGRTMVEQLIDTPDRAEQLGRSSGETLATIHALPAPGTPPQDGTVAHRLAQLDPWLRDRVSVEPLRHTLVHADYHPVNILTDGEGVRSVLDWSNASVAHPLVDLGRSFACLRLGASLFADPLFAGTIEAWWRGLVFGYGASHLSIEDLAPFFAFGLVTLVKERLRIGSPEIPSSSIDALIVERRNWLDLAARSGT